MLLVPIEQSDIGKSKTQRHKGFKVISLNSDQEIDNLAIQKDSLNRMLFLYILRNVWMWEWKFERQSIELNLS